ncbi:MAG: GxxExxY protein, partial [Oscillospiraceae bacterium]
ERRMDVVVNYAGEEFIIELKIWHGEKYNADGEQQVSDYLDYKHHTKGYLLTFNFNQSKKTGISHVQYGDKELIEAIV